MRHTIDLSLKDRAEMEAAIPQLAKMMAPHADGADLDQIHALLRTGFIAAVEGTPIPGLSASLNEDVFESMEALAQALNFLYVLQTHLGLQPGRAPTADEARGRGAAPTEPGALAALEHLPAPRLSLDRVGDQIEGMILQGLDGGGSVNVFAKRMGHTNYRDALPILAYARATGILVETPSARRGTHLRLPKRIHETTPDQDAELIAALRGLIDCAHVQRQKKLVAKLRKFEAVVASGGRDWDELMDWVPELAELALDLQRREHDRLALPGVPERDDDSP